MIRDVLVFTPVYRLEVETVKALMGLRWEGALSLLMQRDNPTGNGVLDHLHQYQRGRERFLAGRYDAMLVIESDVVPPADTLVRLAAVDADVVYGCYMLRVDPDNPVVNVFERYADPQARNVGESLTVRGLWSAAQAAGLVTCSGGGLGCTLIHRRVLDAHPFEIPADEPRVWCDGYWTQSVFRSGWRMMADTGVRCDHVCPDGRVLSVG